MDDPKPDPAAAAREEAARQAIELAITLAVLPLWVWLQRKAAEPDAFRTAKMAAARAAERACATAAARLWGLAERARLAYESERA